LGYGNSTWTSGNETLSPGSAPGPDTTPGTYVIDHIMANNVDETTSNVITRAYTFSGIDSKAYSWLSLGKAGNGTVKWMWYSPDGNLYEIDSTNIPTPSSAYWRSYNAWSYIYIAGNNASNLPGDWHVDVYLDGQKIFTEYFSISGGQSTVSSGNQSFAPVIEQLTAEEILAEAEFFIQGLDLGGSGRYDEAIQAFDKAIEINPQDAVVWFFKGAALSELGKYDEANQAFDKAIEINPQDAEAWYYKGLVLDAQGKQDEAARAYNTSIEIDPQIEDEWWG
jgi:tetratricopeptide (TPR) repeat protein